MHLISVRLSNAAYGTHGDYHRTLLRRAQIDGQTNGVRYATPIRDYRWYRFDDGGDGSYDREEREAWHVAILRLEQLYPLRTELLEAALKPCADGTPVVWVQEEPANMGAWRYLHEQFGRKLFNRFPFDLVSRPKSASPATGSANAHKLEQAQLIARAFGDPEPDAATVLKPRSRKENDTKDSSDEPAKAEKETRAETKMKESSHAH